MNDCHVVKALDWCVGDRVFTFADREVLSVKSIDHQKDTIELCTVEDRIEIYYYFFIDKRYTFYTNIDAEIRNRDAEIKRLQDCIKLLLEKNHDQPK